MSTKTRAIPSHILDSADKTSYYNQVLATALGTISRSTDNILVTKIETAIIRGVLGENNNNIGQLCRSSKINPYSFYKPNGSSIYRFGDFAGYNASAMPPTYFASRPTSDSVSIGLISPGVYGIKLSTVLRRGEKLPIYNPSIDSWYGIKVVFQLREFTGGGGGVILATSTVEGNDVLKMFTSTTVDSDWLTYTTPSPFPNVTKNYRVQIHAYYTNGGVDVAIEDTILAYNITANEYIPPAPPYYDLYVYVHGSTHLEPTPETNDFTEGIYSMPSTKGATYYGDIRCHYLYKPPDGSYPVEWIGYAYLQTIPAGTEAPDAISVDMSGAEAIGLVDTTHSRSLTLEYYNWAGWQQFYSHTFPAS